MPKCTWLLWPTGTGPKAPINWNLCKIKNPQTVASSGFCRKFEVTTNQITMTNLQSKSDIRLQKLIEQRNAKLQKKIKHQKKAILKKDSTTLKSEARTILTNKIKVSDKGCWEWQGALNVGGYGTLYFEKKLWIAHRLSYYAYKLELKAGMYICHKCDNPKCINPEHLFQGTPFENWQDCQNKNRFKGFDNGSIPHNRSLTIEQVKLVKSLFTDSSLTCKQIAEKTGVNYFIVKDIKRGRNYANV